jgi:tRNA threonylcarbamoyladenosine biosynthesis protein TsaE
MQKSNSKFKIDSDRKNIINNLKGTKEFAHEFVESLETGQNLILLQGDLGAGKTTFSQAVLEYFGAEGPFTSPTFVIMKDYRVDFENKNGVKFEKVYHLDCYRIDENCLDDLSWRDIITDKNNLVLVEWPERVEKVLPKRYIKIEFKVLEREKREININRN